MQNKRRDGDYHSRPYRWQFWAACTIVALCIGYLNSYYFIK